MVTCKLVQIGHIFIKKSENYFCKKVKKEFSIDKKITYTNIGTTGSMPKSVLNDYDKNNRIVAKNPWDMKAKFGH